MKKIGWAIILTVIMFFISAAVIGPIISNLGYSAVEGSYHLMTHALILALIFVVIISTMIIMDEIDQIKEKLGINEKALGKDIDNH